MDATRVPKDTGYGVEPSVAKTPVCLFCENPASFNFSLYSPENPGGAFFVLWSTASSCTLHQEYCVIRQLFSQLIIFSPPPPPPALFLLQKPALPRALEGAELCMYGCFDAGHGRLYQGASTGQSQPCGPSPRGSELAASELVSGGCVNLGEMGKRRLHRHTCPMGTRRRENGGRGREWLKRRGTGRMGEAVLDRQRGCAGSCWLSTMRPCCASLGFVRYPVLWVEWCLPKYMFKPSVFRTRPYLKTRSLQM